MDQVILTLKFQIPIFKNTHLNPGIYIPFLLDKNMLKENATSEPQISPCK